MKTVTAEKRQLEVVPMTANEIAPEWQI